MTWKFKKAKHFEQQRVFHEIESDLMPEAFDRKLIESDPIE